MEERKENVRNFLMLKRKDFAFTSSSSSSILPKSLDVYTVQVRTNTSN